MHVWKNYLEDVNDEKGIYSTITMTWNDRSRTLTIGSVKGQFPGMPSSRTFNIRIAGSEEVKTVLYTGTEQSVAVTE